MSPDVQHNPPGRLNPPPPQTFVVGGFLLFRGEGQSSAAMEGGRLPAGGGNTEREIKEEGVVSSPHPLCSIEDKEENIIQVPPCFNLLIIVPSCC